jgi:hypothetical protein
MQATRTNNLPKNSNMSHPHALFFLQNLLGSINVNFFLSQKFVASIQTTNYLKSQNSNSLLHSATFGCRLSRHSRVVYASPCDLCKWRTKSRVRRSQLARLIVGRLWMREKTGEAILTDAHWFLFLCLIFVTFQAFISKTKIWLKIEFTYLFFEKKWSGKRKWNFFRHPIHTNSLQNSAPDTYNNEFSTYFRYSFIHRSFLFRKINLG